MSDEKDNNHHGQGNDDKPYDGPERRTRVQERRTGRERREMVRFEPEKENRRSGQDRRKASRDIWKQRDH